MLKLLKKWSVVVPVLVALAGGLCWVGKALYDRGCAAAKIDQTADGVVELYIARKEMTHAITELDKKVEVLRTDVGNIKDSTRRIEWTLEQLRQRPSQVSGKKVASTITDFYTWRKTP